MPDVFMLAHRAPIISAAARNNVPAVYNLSAYARDGGLLARLRRQHLEGVAGMWRFTAATSAACSLGSAFHLRPLENGWISNCKLSCTKMPQTNE
jgi:hypothetical protein